MIEFTGPPMPPPADDRPGTVLTWTDHGKGYWELRDTADRRLGAVHYSGWNYPPTYSWEAVYRWNGMPSVRGKGYGRVAVAVRTCEGYVRAWMERGSPVPAPDETEQVDWREEGKAKGKGKRRKAKAEG